MTATTAKVQCGYCNRAAKFHATSAHIYGRDYGAVWDCRPCDAYVGCHPNGAPKGTLAKKERREARKGAHALFDPLWQNWQLAYPDANRPTGKLRQLMRLRAYEWLSHHLEIPVNDTHIAMFDEQQCVRVVSLIRQHQPTAASIREWAKARRSATCK